LLCPACCALRRVQPPKDEFTKMLTEALDEKRAREPAAEIDPELKRCHASTCNMHSASCNVQHAPLHSTA
jgi:hypothetical protein